MKFSHKIIENFDRLEDRELRDLKLAWDRLADQAGNPLLNFDWCYACYSTVHLKDTAFALIAYDHGEIVAVAPMVHVRYPGRSRLEIVGTMALFEPSGLLASSRDALAYLLNVLLDSRLPLCLLRIQEQDPVHDVVRRLGPRRFFAFSRPSAPSASLDLECTWDDLERQLSSNRRYDLKRKLRRAEAIGEVALQEHTPNADDMEAYFDIAMAVEHESWKGQAGSSLRANHKLQDFFRQFLLMSCEDRKVRFYFLKVGDTVAAMQISLETPGSCCVLKQGYRESYARISPGILLSHMVIRSCLERGLSTYEFLGSEEDWQSIWPIQHRQFVTILAIPYSIAGARELIAAISSRMRKK